MSLKVAFLEEDIENLELDRGVVGDEYFKLGFFFNSILIVKEQVAAEAWPSELAALSPALKQTKVLRAE